MSHDRASRWVRSVEGLFLCIGVALLAWCASVTARAVLYQQRAESALDGPETPGSSPQGPGYVALVNGRWIVGRLEIPRLHVSVMVVEGDDESALRVAAGHLRETPLPWEHGNSVIAGHRDTFFGALEDVELHDRIRITTGRGQHEYEVSSISVVEPTDTAALEPSPGRAVTLITCYPFTYVGRAPRRFIVRADEVEGTGMKHGAAAG